MSFANDQPGGGFSEVKGYNPPAGSMADEQRRQREADEQRRQNDEAARRSAEVASQQREWDRDFARRSSSKSPAKASASQAAPSSKPARPSWLSPAKTEPRPSRPSRPLIKAAPWNPVFGVAGFLGATAWVASLLQGENRLVLAAAVGLFVGFVVGKLWKHLLWLAAIGGGLWLWSRTRPVDPSSNFTSSSISDPAPSQPAPSFSPSPAQPSSTPAAPSTGTGTLAESFRLPVPKPASPPPAPAPSTAQPLPVLSGYLFLEGDVRFEALAQPGQGHRLTLTHTPHLDHASLRWLQFYYQTGQIIAAIAAPSEPIAYYDLGVTVPPGLREAWRSSLDVTLVHDRGAEPPIVSVKSSYPLGLPEPGPR